MLRRNLSKGEPVRSLGLVLLVHTCVCMYVCAHTHPPMQKHFPSLQSYGRRRRRVYVLALENTRYM